jgi:hypothetical protein
MANIGSAEPLAGPEQNPLDDDNTLTQKAKSSAMLPQPHLRLVHSTDAKDPPADMRSPDRRSHSSDRPPAMLDRSVQAQIGRLLRDVFADVAGEPVPERFIDLLAKLETTEKPR